jgi:hypothetical protein
MIQIALINSNGSNTPERELTLTERATITRSVVTATHIVHYQGDEPPELIQLIAEQSAAALLPNNETLAYRRIGKIVDLVQAMEANPLVDSTKGRELLHAKSAFVEAYKYSDSAFAELMVELQTEISSNGPFKNFLTTQIGIESHMTIIWSINRILQ